MVKEGRPLPATIRCAADVAALILPRVSGLHREAFFTLPLNSRHCPLGFHQVSLGSPDSAPANPRDVYLPAILSGATGIIVVHNHPSGDPTPSDSDARVTDRLREVGELVGIELIDHIVLGEKRLFSFTAGATLPLSD